MGVFVAPGFEGTNGSRMGSGLPDPSYRPGRSTRPGVLGLRLTHSHIHLRDLSCCNGVSRGILLQSSGVYGLYGFSPQSDSMTAYTEYTPTESSQVLLIMVLKVVNNNMELIVCVQTCQGDSVFSGEGAGLGLVYRTP